MEHLLRWCQSELPHEKLNIAPSTLTLFSNILLDRYFRFQAETPRSLKASKIDTKLRSVKVLCSDDGLEFVLDLSVIPDRHNIKRVNTPLGLSVLVGGVERALAIFHDTHKVASKQNAYTIP